MYKQYNNTKQSNIELLSLVSLGAPPEEIEKLLKEGWDPNVRNQDAITPASIAAERNDLEVLKLLIAWGANVDLPDMAGYTPLTYAQLNENAEMIKLIEETIQASAKSAHGKPSFSPNFKK